MSPFGAANSRPEGRNPPRIRRSERGRGSPHEDATGCRHLHLEHARPADVPTLSHGEAEGGGHADTVAQVDAEGGRGGSGRGIFEDVGDGEEVPSLDGRGPSNVNASNVSREAIATTGWRFPAKAWASGIRSSRSSRVRPSRPRSRSATASSRSMTCGSTLVKPATMRPPSVAVTTSTAPAAVSNMYAPTPSTSASATAVAIVACPQNGTSSSGEKYRTATRRPSRSPTNAVSGWPRSAAMRCICASSRAVASRTTPAGLPPPGSAAKARRCRIPRVGVMGRFSREPRGVRAGRSGMRGPSSFRHPRVAACRGTRRGLGEQP
ncbi:MAG: hypothetical protein K0R81_1805 [Microbacterium sp.]|nr:hypothetical protein [Microbacterium sp.]